MPASPDQREGRSKQPAEQAAPGEYLVDVILDQPPPALERLQGAVNLGQHDDVGCSNRQQKRGGKGGADHAADVFECREPILQCGGGERYRQHKPDDD